ncbi:MAG: hypothetical protein E7446_05615 [Ruminococcaceae bacterium]|nr:hypothetical protein [Oscillospiraceae bacterium]
MKKLFTVLLTLLLLSLTACRRDIVTDDKPVIYLYPETETQVTVTLDYDGVLTSAYPAYEDGWTVTAQPDGTLTDADGRTYYCLFWEGESGCEYDFSQGFCVAGRDTAPFLEDALAQLGLTEKEANEFIIYWLPRMEHNTYNLISFQSDCYTDSAALHIDPAPDSMLRIFMAWQALDKAVDVPTQPLPAFTRSGFTVVEWGGAQVK